MNYSQISVSSYFLDYISQPTISTNYFNMPTKVDHYALITTKGIPWLLGNGVESISGVTSIKSALVNIRPVDQKIDFFGEIHHAQEAGDLPLGDGEFIRNVHILPNLSPELNVLSSALLKQQSDTHNFWFMRDEYEKVDTAGTHSQPEKFEVFHKGTLCYALIPVPSDENLTVMKCLTDKGLESQFLQGQYLMGSTGYLVN